MTLNLQQTLSWTRALAAKSPDSAAELAMLHDLQANVLKGHGHRFTVHLFLSFDPGRRAAARAFVAEVGGELTTALEQLTGNSLFKAAGVPMPRFVGMFLSAKGYEALGQRDAMPQARAFRAGMRERTLSDPPPSQWDAHLAAQVHAMLLIGVDSEHEQAAVQREFYKRIGATAHAVTLLGMESGQALFNEDGNGIEHFGYVDGRSQPLALQEDVDYEHSVGGTDKWDPSIPLSQLLVKCPGGNLAVSHGSYFVFRKLEQNVQGFKRRESELAELMVGDGERAGASVIGRFENGTPATLHEDEVHPIPPGDAGLPNNFNYGDDQAGLRCPFAAHIRKANPRSDLPDAKSHLMARRGIPYGSRTDHPGDEGVDNKPVQGVGLLFMAYQSDLEKQFEVSQRFWANNADSSRQQVGIDPIIGQGRGAGDPGQRFPRQYDKSLTEPFDFSGFVTLKGGEYFFAPSISFLKSMG